LDLIHLQHVVLARDLLSWYQKKGKRTGGNYKDPPICNGPGPSTGSLACAIQYISLTVHHTILEISWIIVEAINIIPDCYIFNPEPLEPEKKIAAGLEKSRTPKINYCAGAIDEI
ncbi:hypothetical protein HJC23_000155, partial [Cyclotella cryptica]